MTVKQNLALVFPGQGSQKIGMLSDFSDCVVVKDTFLAASDALGYDLWSLVQSGSQDELNMTEVTQPALLTCSVALWRLWLDQGGVTPAYMAGHSLGEWSALVCAGVIAFEDAVKLVRLRGKYMQEAVPAGEGAMAAIIGLDDDKIERICADLSESGVVAPVNYNSPGQVVIAGAKSAVELAMAECKKAGAKRALPLPVSAPFHTSLMEPAANRLAQDLSSIEFGSPQIPVVHNVTAATETDANTIKSLMIEQIYSPVRWVSCVQYLAANTVTNLVEVGPGKVLSGLAKRIDSNLSSTTTETLVALDASIVAN